MSRKVFFSFLWVGFLATTSACASWHGRVVEVRDGQQLSMNELAERLGVARNIILAEKHATPAVQKAQADLLERTVRAHGWQNQLTLGWEFLNVSDQEKIRRIWRRYLEGEARLEDVLALSQGGKANMTYVPLLQALKESRGELIGVNLSREQKAPVVKEGIEAADPETVPPGFEMGGNEYFERFEAAMKGHAKPEQIRNYFAAQCLVDDVAAYHLITDSDTARRFLVIGSFHTDYFDGAMNRLLERWPEQESALVRFVDASDFAEAQLMNLLRHPDYGEIADFVVFVNEPATESREIPMELKL